MLEFAITPLLAFHLMSVNVATAGPLICMWLDWREGRGCELAGRAGRYLAGVSLSLFVVGMGLGALTAYLAWDETHYNLLMRRMPTKVQYGIMELLFSLVLMGVYAMWWKFSQRSRWQRIVRMILILFSATNLIYHFPALFLKVPQLVANGEASGSVMGTEDFRQWLMDGEILSRTIHFLLASVAVAGVMLIGYALRLNKEDKQEDAQRVATWGARIALVPTLLQIPVGLWVMFALSNTSRDQLMGRDLSGTVMMGLGVLTALYLMHLLASISLGPAPRKKMIMTMIFLTVTVLLMTGAVRRANSTRRPSKVPVTASQASDSDATSSDATSESSQTSP